MTQSEDDYWPDNIVTDAITLSEQLRKTLLPIYKTNHSPSYRLLTIALQNLKFAIEQDNLKGIVEAYNHLMLFRS